MQSDDAGAGDEYPGDVLLDDTAGVDVPDHCARDVVGRCAGIPEHATDEGEGARNCDEVVVIDRSSLGFIASAAGIGREEALLCDAHLNERLAGVTLDLSIGSAHTRSDEFEQAREERSAFADTAGADAKASEQVEIYDWGKTEWGPKAYARLPPAAKSAIESCDWEDVHQKQHSQRSAADTDDAETIVFEIDLAAVDTVAALLDGEGWTVDVDEDVLRAARSAAASDRAGTGTGTGTDTDARGDES
jgi:hypothetical protein